MSCFLLFVNVLLLAQEADQEDALRKMRTFAEHYAASLRDFSCVKRVTRSGKPVTGGDWKPLETSEEDISYVNGKETHELITVNGKPAKGRSGIKGGHTRIFGEFAMLGHLFAPSTKMDVLKWDRQEGPQCIFRYHAIDFITWSSGNNGQHRATTGQSGTIYSVCETGVIIRLDAATEERAEQFLSASIRFEPVTIGGRQFQLPHTVENESRFRKNLTRAEVTFFKYRKYDSSSSVHFEPQP